VITSSPVRTDGSVISAKIAEIRENKISRYEPLIRPEAGLTYTGFSDHDFARQLDILKTLQVLEIVKEEPFDFIRRCSRCDHHGMLVKVACPVCSSTNTEQGKVIEHLACGNIDLESKFQSDDGRVVCPKCKKKLKAIGVDYVKPGSFCACLSCKALSPEGKMQFVCLNCGSSLAKEEMKLEPLAAYVVDQEAVAKYLDKTGLQFHMSVVDALRSRGIKATPMAAVTGSSQVEHRFDIVGFDSEGGPAVAVDVEKSADPVNSESLLNFLGRCLDAKVGRKVFIGIPGFSVEAKKLAGTHGIEIIESSGNDPEEVAAKIAGRMPQEQVPDEQLEEMIESMNEAVQEQENGPDVEKVSLERMLKAIISSPKDDSQEGG
jgi:hypothetical protein